MNEFKTIKKELLRDTTKIETLLEKMGCDYISYEQGGDLITCQLPYDKFQSNNKRAVQIRLNESLTSVIRNRSDFDKSDIFNLVSYIHFDKRDSEIQENLHHAKEFICQTCGLTRLMNKHIKRRSDSDLDWLLNIKEKRKKKPELIPNPVIDESVLDNFMPYISMDWIKEGITPDIQNIYGVMYCPESHRIVFPVRDRHGNLIGVKGRLMKDDGESPKYLYLNKCNVSQEWFNYHFAYNYIKTEKKVIIFEAEKSCMKLASHGIWNSLAICSSDISKAQVNILKRFGDDLEIYLAYDKDKTIKEIKKQAQKFEGMKVYAIYDTEGLLGQKDSPIDCGIEVFNKLISDCCFEVNV